MKTSGKVCLCGSLASSQAVAEKSISDSGLKEIQTSQAYLYSHAGRPYIFFFSLSFIYHALLYPFSLLLSLSHACLPTTNIMYYFAGRREGGRRGQGGMPTMKIDISFLGRRRRRKGRQERRRNSCLSSTSLLSSIS